MSRHLKQRCERFYKWRINRMQKQKLYLKTIIKMYRDLLRENVVKIGGPAHMRMRELLDRLRSR